MDDGVPLPDVGWRCPASIPGVVGGGITLQRDDDLRGLDQPGSCADVDGDTGEFVGVQSGTVSEMEELAPVVSGLRIATQEVWGPTPMG